MEFRCKACGAVLAPSPTGGLPTVCTYCGAPQQLGPGGPVNPYGGPPQPFVGGPAQPYGSPVVAYGSPGSVLTRSRAAGAGCAIAAVAITLAVAGAGLAFTLVRTSGSTSGATSPGDAFPIAQLSTLSLARTPDAMAKVTGVTPTKDPTGGWDMEVKLAGGSWNRLDLTWDAADTSHVKMAYLYADAPPQNDAAIRQKLASIFGRRFDKDSRFNWGTSFLSYSGDSAYAEADPKSGSDANPHWKQQADAMWDVMRAGILGQSIAIPDAEARDWLARGYTLTAIGAIDPGVDVDHAAAMMAAAFPAVQTRVSGSLSNTLAVDHPWYGYAEISWADEKGGTLEGLYLYPPPDAKQQFANQTEIGACVQAIVGGKPRHYEGDHLKGDYSDEWDPPVGGEVRVYGHLVHVTAGGHFARKMPRAEWQKLLDGLDACGRKK